MVPTFHQMLKTVYGSPCYRDLNILSTCLRKSATTEAGWEFLLRCRRCHVFPAFITRSIKFAQLGRNLERLARRLPVRMLNAAIRDMRIRTICLQQEIDSVWRSLFRLILDPCIWNQLVQQKDNYYNLHYTLATQKLKKKFVKLFAVYPNDTYTDNVSLLFATSQQSGSDPPKDGKLQSSGGLTSFSSPKLATTSELLVLANSSAGLTRTMPSQEDRYFKWDTSHCFSPVSGALLDATLLSDPCSQVDDSLEPDFRSCLSWQSWEFINDPEISTFSSIGTQAPQNLELDVAFNWSSVMGPQKRHLQNERLDDELEPSLLWSLTPEKRFRLRAVSFEEPFLWNHAECSSNEFRFAKCDESTPIALSRQGASLLDVRERLHGPNLRSSTVRTIFGKGTPERVNLSFTSETSAALSRKGASLVDVRERLDILESRPSSDRPAHSNGTSEQLTLSLAAQTPTAPNIREFSNCSPNDVPVPFGTFVPFLEQNDLRLTTDVINLSTFNFSAVELTLLNNCLKFRPTPSVLPSVELIASSESVARFWDLSDPEKSANFHNECAEAIKKASKPDPNLTVPEKKILKHVSQNSKLVVTQADKGGKLVLLDLNQYSEMCLQHLEEDVYEKINVFGKGKGKVVLFDPVSKNSQDFVSDSFGALDPYDKLLKSQCAKLTTILNKLVKEKQLDKEERKRLIPSQPYSGTVPKFYGLPKVHKSGFLKIRPIVSSCGLYCDDMAVLMKKVLNLLLWGTTSIANSYELVNLLENYQFSEDDILVSFDVTSLFTKVPVPETLKIVEARLTEMRELESDPIAEITSLSNSAIMEILTYMLNDCYFTWDKTLYQQRSGVPMGGRLSPILATLFMESLEYSVLCSAPIVPKIYFRYVDDILIIWDLSKGDYGEFLRLLNNYHPSIALTEEKETNRSLAFLDVRITRPTISEAGTVTKPVKFSIFRKPTHSNRYLNFKSAHPLDLKENVVRGLGLRAHRILKNDPVELAKELRFLKRSLSNDNNGYPLKTLNGWFAKLQ